MSPNLRFATRFHELLEPLAAVSAEHERWVDGFGLQSGDLGPLDVAILDAEAFLGAAREAKARIEEEPEEPSA